MFDTAVAPGPVRSDPLRSDPTRLICSAVHLDTPYRRRVLEHTVDNPHRAIGPCYDTDLAAVVTHALVAERRVVRRDAALVCVQVLVLLALAVAVLSGVGRRVAEQQWAEIAATWWLWAVLVVAAWSVWAIVFAEVLARLTTIGRHLLLNGDPAGLARPADLTLSDLARFDAARDGNLVVFSGYRPFIGCGEPVYRDSTTTSLVPSKDKDKDKDEEERTRPGRPPRDFTARALVDELADAFRGIKLPGLVVQERLYADGQNAGRASGLRPDDAGRTVGHVGQDVLDLALTHPSEWLRHYLCVRVPAWRDQLVVTFCTRVVKLGDVLFVEYAAFAVSPLGPVFRKVDGMYIRTPAERLRAAVGETFRTVAGRVFLSWVDLIHSLRRRQIAAQRQRDHELSVRDNVLIDYGATTSLREEAGGGIAVEDHFLRTDVEMYVYIVGVTLQERVRHFLRDHGFADDEITFIDNSVRTGDVFGSNNAFGRNARASGGRDEPARPSAKGEK